MSDKSVKKVVVLGTGGTIAGLAQDRSDTVGYAAAQIGVDALLSGLNGAACLPAGYQLVCMQVAQVDSKDMTFGIWRDLALQCQAHLSLDDVVGIVITHGTDTLEETAFFLDRVLPKALTIGKPVVFTCAMRPASALVPDGPQNLLDAISVALDPDAHGVLVVCAGLVHAARRVQKVHPYRLDAFDSGEDGPVGFVEEGRLRQVNKWPRALDLQDSSAMRKIANAVSLPRVEIVLNHAGAQGRVVDCLLLDLNRPSDPLRGIVVAATGNGTVSVALGQALERAQALGIRVVLSTRCPYGQIVGEAETRFSTSRGLSPVKARIDLMLDLID